MDVDDIKVVVNDLDANSMVSKILRFLKIQERHECQWLFERVVVKTSDRLEMAVVPQQDPWSTSHTKFKDLVFGPIDTTHHEILKNLKPCTCSASHVILSSLRTTLMPCVCGSFMRPLENFARNFSLCPLTLETVDKLHFFGRLELPMKCSLKMPFETFAQLKDWSKVEQVRSILQGVRSKWSLLWCCAEQMAPLKFSETASLDSKVLGFLDTCEPSLQRPTIRLQKSTNQHALCQQVEPATKTIRNKWVLSRPDFFELEDLSLMHAMFLGADIEDSSDGLLLKIRGPLNFPHKLRVAQDEEGQAMVLVDQDGQLVIVDQIHVNLEDPKNVLVQAVGISASDGSAQKIEHSLDLSGLGVPLDF